MDGIFGALIWLIIIFIWIFSAAKKSRRKDSESRKDSPSEFEKKILEALGISFPNIPEPPIQEPLETKGKKPSPAFAENQISLFEAPKPVAAKVIAKEAETGSSDLLTEEKLQEGIVLSIILGPPKAYRFLDFSSRIHPRH
jgi:hypothetical protein